MQDPAVLVDIKRRLQLRAANICKKYNLPIKEAIKAEDEDDARRAIDDQERLIRSMEEEVERCKADIKNMTSLVAEANTILAAQPPNTPGHDAARNRIAYLEKLPKRLKGEWRVLGKEKKRLERMQANMAAAKHPCYGYSLGHVSDDIMMGWFNYGYYPDMWEGIEHFVPEGVSPCGVIPLSTWLNDAIMRKG